MTHRDDSPTTPATLVDAGDCREPGGVYDPERGVSIEEQPRPRFDAFVMTGNMIIHTSSSRDNTRPSRNRQRVSDSAKNGSYTSPSVSQSSPVTIGQLLAPDLHPPASRIPIKKTSRSSKSRLHRPSGQRTNGETHVTPCDNNSLLITNTPVSKGNSDTAIPTATSGIPIAASITAIPAAPITNSGIPIPSSVHKNVNTQSVLSQEFPSSNSTTGIPSPLRTRRNRRSSADTPAIGPSKLTGSRIPSASNYSTTSITTNNTSIKPPSQSKTPQYKEQNHNSHHINTSANNNNNTRSGIVPPQKNQYQHHRGKRSFSFSNGSSIPASTTTTPQQQHQHDDGSTRLTASPRSNSNLPMIVGGDSRSIKHNSKTAFSPALSITINEDDVFVNSSSSPVTTTQSICSNGVKDNPKDILIEPLIIEEPKDSITSKSDNPSHSPTVISSPQKPNLSPSELPSQSDIGIQQEVDIKSPISQMVASETSSHQIKHVSPSEINSEPKNLKINEGSFDGETKTDFSDDCSMSVENSTYPHVSTAPVVPQNTSPICRSPKYLNTSSNPSSHIQTASAKEIHQIDPLSNMSVHSPSKDSRNHVITANAAVKDLKDEVLVDESITATVVVGGVTDEDTDSALGSGDIVIYDDATTPVLSPVTSGPNHYSTPKYPLLRENHQKRPKSEMLVSCTERPSTLIKPLPDIPSSPLDHDPFFSNSTFPELGRFDVHIPNGYDGESRLLDIPPDDICSEDEAFSRDHRHLASVDTDQLPPPPAALLADYPSTTTSPSIASQSLSKTSSSSISASTPSTSSELPYLSSCAPFTPPNDSSYQPPPLLGSDGFYRRHERRIRRGFKSRNASTNTTDDEDDEEDDEDADEMEKFAERLNMLTDRRDSWHTDSEEDDGNSSNLTSNSPLRLLRLVQLEDDENQQATSTSSSPHLNPPPGYGVGITSPPLSASTKHHPVTPHSTPGQATVSCTRIVDSATPTHSVSTSPSKYNSNQTTPTSPRTVLFSKPIDHSNQVPTNSPKSLPNNVAQTSEAISSPTPRSPSSAPILSSTQRSVSMTDSSTMTTDLHLNLEPIRLLSKSTEDSIPLESIEYVDSSEKRLANTESKINCIDAIEKSEPVKDEQMEQIEFSGENKQCDSEITVSDDNG